MEKVLHRLPEGGDPAESSSGYTTRSKPYDSHSVTSASSHSDVISKSTEYEAQKATILRTLQTVPALAERIDRRTESMRMKIVEARTHIPAPAFTPTHQETSTNNADNILRLQKYVENSGHQLEIMCQTMEQTCEVLRNERDMLKRDIEERDKKFRIVTSHEQDFLRTINSLRSNLESTTHRVTQLSTENKLLKEQVKILPSLQESDFKVKQLADDLNLLHKDVKDLSNLQACQIELKRVTEKLARVEEENKVIPSLKYIEEKYKALSAENEQLREENKVIPVLRRDMEKVSILSAQVASLQTEKKNLEETVMHNKQEMQRLRESQKQVGVAEATKRLTQRLQDAIKERDDAQHDAQMLRIEREKLLVLSHTKDEELAHFVQDIMSVKTMVTSQLDNLKKNLPRMVTPCISEDSNSSTDSEELTLFSSHCQPVCSSPTSTASGMVLVDEVWQDVSAIMPEHTRSSPELLLNVNSKKAEESESPPEFKSIGLDTWHNVHSIGQGEVCLQEDDDPPRPHTAVPGPRPPFDHNTAGFGDSQWTGAAVVTHELQQNVQELFRFINSTSKPTTASSIDAQSSARTTGSVASSLPSLKHQPVQSTQEGNRNFNFKMPKLPEPPKFLETPEFSDISSYHGSVVSSSVESIDVLKAVQKSDRKKKQK